MSLRKESVDGAKRELFEAMKQISKTGKVLKTKFLQWDAQLNGLSNNIQFNIGNELMSFQCG